MNNPNNCSTQFDEFHVTRCKHGQMPSTNCKGNRGVPPCMNEDLLFNEPTQTVIKLKWEGE
jgi:hypothetical protein